MVVRRWDNVGRTHGRTQVNSVTDYNIDLDHQRKALGHYSILVRTLYHLYDFSYLQGTAFFRKPFSCVI